VNTPGLAFRVGVLRANDDAGMVRGTGMRLNEITSVEGEQRASMLSGKGQYTVICDSLISLPRLQASQHVMSQRSQGFHHLKREVLVGILGKPWVRPPRSR